MKNKLSILSFVFVFLSILSCSFKQDNDPSIQTILIDPDKVEDNIDISFLVENELEIIKLETTPGSLISRTDKLIHKYDRFFVLDSFYENLYMFDQAGKYMGKIGEKGGGPGEYYRLEDVYIGNEQIYLLDQLGDIFIYDLEGTFKERLSFPAEFYSEEFLIHKNGIFFVNHYWPSSLGNYLFYYYNPESHTLSGQLPFNEGAGDSAVGLVKYMDEYKDEVLIIYAATDKVYQVTDTLLTPKYRIKFTSRELPNSFKTKDKMTVYKETKENKYLTGINSLDNIGAYLVAEYTDGDAVRTAFIDRGSLSVSVCDWLVLGNWGGLCSSYMFHTDDRLFIVQDAERFKFDWEHIYSKNSFKNENDRERLKRLALEIDEEDNPIIFTVKLKK